jgi:hypothetical protein
LTRLSARHLELVVVNKHYLAGQIDRLGGGAHHART